MGPRSSGFLVRMLQKAINILLFLSPFIFGQEAEIFGCCMFKEVQGEGGLAGVYYLVETDQPFPDVCSLDACTYKKVGNGEAIFCFKPSTRYESTCLATVEGYGYGNGYSGEPTAEPSAEPSGEWPVSLEYGYGYGYGYSYSGEPMAEPSAEPSAEPTAEPSAEPS